MATLKFDGVDDYLEGSGHGAMNGALTIAMLAYRFGTAQQTLFFTQTSVPGTSLAFQMGADDKFLLYNATPAAFSNGVTIVPPSYWFILVMTRGNGLSTPRFHYKNITTDTAWVHEAASASQNNPPTVAGGKVRIGRTVSTAHFKGDVAVAAWWDGIELNDSQVATLSTNKKTSDWNALSPNSLTELNTLTPIDLKALETWIVSGPTLTGPDPPGWTFDGLGPPPEPEEPEPTEEGVLKVLTSTGWRSLEGPPGSPGIVETYEQTDEPETSTIGAIWIRQEPL